MNPVRGILLAAGAGSRFGGGKLLHPLQGTVLGVVSLRRLQAITGPAVAVVRPGDDALAQYLEAEGAQVVACPLAIDGMGHSLACGVMASQDAGGWLVALADMPQLREQTLRAVHDTLVAGQRIVVPVYQGQRGHPVGFPARHGAALMALGGDQGARALLQREAEHLCRLEVDDPGVLLDVDAREDLARLGA